MNYSDTPEYKREYHKKWRAKNSERAKAIQAEYRKNHPDCTRDWRKANPLKHMMNKLRQRAKKAGLEFNLKPEDINIPEYCPILGLKLSTQDGLTANTPSVDRIDNTKGYLPDNIRVISYRANGLKSNMNKETLQKLIDYIDGKI